MNHSRFWSVFCAILFLGSCAESELTLDKDMLLSFEASILSDDLNDLFMDGAPEEFQAAIATMLQNGVGSKLLQRVKSRFVKDIRIQFKPFLDRNGEIVREPAKMGYAGNGVIYYTYTALKHKCNDELLFHEFFHIYQTGEIIRKSRNNEVEAYIAQLLYYRSKGSSSYAVLIDGLFTKIIMDLAAYIDPTTGYFKTGIDRSKFNELYTTALNYLEIHPDYYGDEWTSNWSPLEYPFPNLSNLLNEDL